MRRGHRADVVAPVQPAVSMSTTEIDVLGAEPETLQQAQASAVEQQRNEEVRSVGPVRPQAMTTRRRDGAAFSAGGNDRSAVTTWRGRRSVWWWRTRDRLFISDLSKRTWRHAVTCLSGRRWGQTPLVMRSGRTRRLTSSDSGCWQRLPSKQDMKNFGARVIS